MKLPAHIVLCTEADADVGLGHAVRCAGLLRALRREYKLTVMGGGSLLRQFFPAANHVPAPNWTQLDWTRMDLPRPDLVLADIPVYRQRDWDRVRCPGAALVAIDDHGGCVPADLVINGTVMPEYQRYDTSRPPNRLCVGPAYALIRPEFAATPWQGATSTVVTAMFGSGAQAREWALALAAAGSTSLRGRRLRLVVGNGFDALTLLGSLCANRGIELQVGLSAVALAPLVAGSAAMLVTAGMGLYESVAAGVPVVAYPQIADLCSQAAWFAHRGACINLGLGNAAPETATRALVALLADPQALRAMSDRQRTLLDGRGVARVAALLDTLLEARP